jgi:predicted nucleic acid-binding protein
MRTWVDASTLIALEAIGELDFLRESLGEVRITAEIAKEVLTDRSSAALRQAIGSWILVEPVEGDAGPLRRLGLGRGEASLFLAPREDRLLLDELPARRLASAEGREYVGLLGLLLAAARTGTVSRSRARAMLDRLAGAGFRMTVELFERMRSELEE